MYSVLINAVQEAYKVAVPQGRHQPGASTSDRVSAGAAAQNSGQPGLRRSNRVRTEVSMPDFEAGNSHEGVDRISSQSQRRFRRITGLQRHVLIFSSLTFEA